MRSVENYLSMLLMLAATSAFAKPAEVVIIRHGEKPAQTSPPQSQADQVDQQGCERAFALPSFFKANFGKNSALGKPVAVYAQAPNDDRKSNPDDDTGSLRPLQTIMPTAANWLGLKVNANFIHNQATELVKEIMTSTAYDGKVVIISWEHQAIPQLAESFGLASAQAPQHWPDVVFDEAWVLSFSDAAITLTIVPENVLPTDNPMGGLTAWTKGPQTPTGSSSVLASAIIAECQNNSALNALVKTDTNSNSVLLSDIVTEINSGN